VPTTQSIVEKILYLSLYDARYQQIPEQDKLTIYQIICDELNQFSQIEGKNLTTSYTKSYTNAVNSGTGYSIIDTTVGNTVPGNWTIENVTFNFANINYPLTYTDNENFQSQIALINVPSFPSIWTWYLPTQSIWVYPIPVVQGTFFTLGRPLLPTISVTYDPEDNLYIFDPTDIDLPVENNFFKYATYYTAQQVCEYFNSVFSEQKEKTLEKLKRQLLNNKEANFVMKTLPSELTMGNSKSDPSFPYFYYLSGGGN
jgi:hypothetical protein